jgi:hypothetical protein
VRQPYVDNVNKWAHVHTVDGDIFGVVTRLGRAAADAVARALEGGRWDPFFAAQCLDDLHAKAGGLPTLPGVLRILEGLRATPLLAYSQREAAIERLNDVHRNTEGVTTLDLMLRCSAEKSIWSGEYDSVRVLERYCQSALDAAIMSSRGGYLETHGHTRKEDARTLLAPIATAAAETLARRPTARRLGLAPPHANLQPDTDLLGSGE